MRNITTIFLHHSGTLPHILTWEEIRAYHIRPEAKGGKGFDDIGYHFGITFDNGEFAVKIGRPVAIQGAHVLGYNTDSIGIMIEGNFERLPPYPEQLDLLHVLLVDLCTEYELGAQSVLGHREAPYATLCPGKYFPIEEIRGRLATELRLLRDRQEG